MPGQSPPRAPNSLQRRLVAAFTQQVPLKATAVFLAVGLWFMVNTKEPPQPQSELVPVRLIPTLDSSLVLRDPLPEIKALVDGPPKDLIRLNSTLPTIHRQISSDVPDTVVIDLRPSDVVLPDGVDGVVRDIQPRSITLRFESTWTRNIPVRSVIDVATPNGSPGPLSLRLDPLTVEVTGPRHLVARIAFVKTVRTTIPFPDSLPHLVELDTAGLGAGVRLRPSQVKVLVMLASHR